MTGVKTLTNKIPGFRTSLNNKSKSVIQLANHVKGPPVNRAPIILSQLKQNLAEVETAFKKLMNVVDEILNIVVEDDDQTTFTHYTSYRETVSKEFESTRLEVVLTIALIETVNATISWFSLIENRGRALAI